MSIFANLIRCACGGTATIATEFEYGRTVERCRQCGYEGPPRPAIDNPDELTPRGMKRQRVKPCVDGCGRMAYSWRAERCRPCAQERHLAQTRSAKLRAGQRAAGLRDAAPLQRTRRAS